MKIIFKQKVKEIICPVTFKVKEGVIIPLKFNSGHWDRKECLDDAYWAKYANSDIIHAALKRRMSELGIKHGKNIALDHSYSFITIDTSKFLAVVTIEL